MPVEIASVEWMTWARMEAASWDLWEKWVDNLGYAGSLA